MSKESKPYKLGMPYWQAQHFKHHLHSIVCSLFCGCYYSKLPNEKMKELLGELEIAYKNFVRFIEYQIETGYPFVFCQYDKVLEEYWTISDNNEKGEGEERLGGIRFSQNGIKFIDVLLSIHRNQINKGQID